MKTKYYKTAAIVASGDVCLASLVEDFNAGGSAGTIVSVSATSTVASFDVMIMETDPGTGWGGAASAELDRHNQCFYKVSATSAFIDNGEYPFVCRDTTLANTLWVGVKAGTAASATINLTLRWVVEESPQPAIEVT